MNRSSRPSPPTSEEELLERATALAGRTVGAIAAELDLLLPHDLRRQKGWLGQLLELALGADAASRAEPDFTALGVELKSIPLSRHGRPLESTYVCTVPLEAGGETVWERSWPCRKLSRVLWIPVEGERTIPLAERRIGTPLLWSPSEAQQRQLQRDWEELTEMIQFGEVEQITARLGTALHIRPKAANARSRCRASGRDGETILTNPRGFYLRTSFTAALLEKLLQSP